jgi:SNF2 family DNA or RNA helicase
MWNQEAIQKGDNIPFWKKEGDGWKNVLTDTKVSRRPSEFRGGILADDMGLGKTISIISLILKAQPKEETKPISLDCAIIKERERDPFGFLPTTQLLENEPKNLQLGSIPSKSTLIICPLSLIHNWEDQIESHTQKNSLSILVYHGPNRSNDPKFIAKHDVVITTYNVIGFNFGKGGEILPLLKIYWHRIVLDEAHIIKSASTFQAKAVFAFHGDIKWCLTGTPVQNKLDGMVLFM